MLHSYLDLYVWSLLSILKSSRTFRSMWFLCENACFEISTENQFSIRGWPYVHGIIGNVPKMDAVSQCVFSDPEYDFTAK
jgi:hypothetical protein